MARSDVEEALSQAEERLVACARTGRAWSAVEGESNRIRSSVIRDLVSDIDEALRVVPLTPVNPKGLEIYGATVVADRPDAAALDLEGVRVCSKLWFDDCAFVQPAADGRADLPGVISIRDAHAKSLGFLGCSFQRIDARRSHIQGNLYLDRANCDECVDLHNAIVEGEMSCCGMLIGSDRAPGSDDAPAGPWSHTHGYALRAETSEIGGSVLLTSSDLRQFEARGKVSFVRSSIGGRLDCRGGTFRAARTVEGDKGRRIALHLDGVRVDASVMIGEGFKSSGEVNIVRAKVRSDVRCGGGTFRGGTGNDLRPSHNRGLLPWRLRSRDTPVPCVALNFQSAEIDEGLYLDDAASAERTMIDGALILSHAACELFCDGNANSRSEYIAGPPPGCLELDGFIYSRLGNCSTAWKSRVRWLQGQKTGHLVTSFRPQPWVQLINVLDKMGYKEDARFVSIKKQVELRKSDSLNPVQKLMNLFLGVTVGHGHKPFHALIISVFLLAPAYFVFSIAAQEGWMAPQNGEVLVSSEYWSQDDCQTPAGYRELNALYYVVDSYIPIIDQYHERDWGPSSVSAECAKQTNPSHWTQYLQVHHSAALSNSYEMFFRKRFENGWLEIIRWALIVSGWILVPLFLAGVTGTMKRFED
ncbi:hypothetical protein [Maricaulis sp.]|uniref:hypothetical protein n=1 Tax=Maricaulis sp. TaxID=1486257 RepID=UPI0026161BC5|nr:hypothetical protein [Maricaulis sp.]